MFKKKGEVWIGIASVLPIEGNDDLGDALGATVNVLHWAVSANNFYTKVKKQLLQYGFQLTELTDLKPFNFYEGNEYKDNLLERAHYVLEQKELQWGTFYTYDKKE